ncbi:hypothetical protein ABEV09_18405 [Schinkia azotoformans]|uniref:hypothetical protein n=1 Tax=Schinkia azotoformans TaxID=1454 RepID=UPI002DBE2D1F|nr:hypothetical protein [Schinkia azotoformans]MEC1714855.1 hypothetical protein [Schinkia azotoformans]
MNKVGKLPYNSSLLYQRGNKMRDLAIILFFCFPLLKAILERSIGLLISNGTIITGIAILILYTPILTLLFKNPRSIKVDAIIVIFLVIFIFLFSYLYHPEYSSWYNDPIWGLKTRVFNFSSGVFAYFFIRLEENPKIILRNLKIVAIVMFFYNVFRPIEVIKNGYWLVQLGNETNVQSVYSMGFGYSMLLPSLLLIYFGIKEKKLLFILMSIVGVIEIFLWGSRGALLTYACFIALYILFADKKLFGTKKIIFIILSILLFFVISNGAIMSSLLDKLNEHGIESRTLNMIVSGEATSDSGRDTIQEKAKYMIENGGFFGYGAYADRYYIGKYSHNIVLEMMITFGKYPAIFILIVLTFYSIKMIIRCKNREWLELFIIFFSYACTRLWNSTSFWYESTFWIAIGIVVSYHKLLKYRKD